MVNMLYYIIGEEVLYEMMDGVEVWHENWNNLADEETNVENIGKPLKNRQSVVKSRWCMQPGRRSQLSDSPKA